MKIFRIVEEENGLGKKFWKIEEKDIRFNFWPFTKLGTWEVCKTRNGYGLNLYCMNIPSLDEAKATYNFVIETYTQQVLANTKKMTVVEQREV